MDLITVSRRHYNLHIATQGKHMKLALGDDSVRRGLMCLCPLSGVYEISLDQARISRDVPQRLHYIHILHWALSGVGHRN